MRRLVAAGVVLVILGALVVAQLVLPGVAAQRLRDRLSHSGRVVSVSVSAFPAIELLWHQAGTVNVHMASYHSSSGGLARLLDQAGDVGSLTARADLMQTGLLTLRDAKLVKHGQTLSGSAQVSEADLRASLPILQSVTPVASGNGQLVLRGTTSLFGLSAEATVGASDGDLVVSVPPLPGITLFHDPHLGVESVSASPTPSGFSVRASGLLH